MKIVLYTNILTPYRRHFYDLLYQECTRKRIEFEVWVMAKTEPNRSWMYSDLKTSYTVLLKDILVKYKEIYVHCNVGMKRFIKDKKPDIVICAGGYLCSGIFQICRWKKKYGYSVVFWSESHLHETRNYNHLIIKAREKIRRKIYSQFDGFWYAGRLSKEFIEKYAKENAYYYFMPNLVDKDVYKVATTFSSEEKQIIMNKYAVSSERKIMVCPARLSPAKGILEFIDLLKNTTIKDAYTILVAGSGALEEKIMLELEKAGIDMRLLGYKTQSEMVELYAIADVFLMPSLSDPNPLTCVEALWAGLPLVVSSHVGNYPEIVKQEINGYVFDYSKKSHSLEIFDKLSKQSTEWYSNAKKVSRELAEDKYDSDRILAPTIEYLINQHNQEEQK